MSKEKQRKPSIKAPERYQDQSKEEKTKILNAHEWYRNLCKEEKIRQYGRKRCKTLPEDEKQRLIEYRKNYSRMLKVTTDSCFSWKLNKTIFKDFCFCTAIKIVCPRLFYEIQIF